MRNDTVYMYHGNVEVEKFWYYISSVKIFAINTIHRKSLEA